MATLIPPAVTAPDPPAGAIRIWPGNPLPYYTTYESAAYTLGTQFSVSTSCPLLKIWWYSPPDATVLPAICGIWDAGAQALITEDAAPAWLDPDGGTASPGDGWVYCDFSAADVTLVSGVNYVVSVFQPASATWWVTVANYWTPGSGLGGQNGITDGLLTAPDTTASVNGQGCYDTTGTWEFPGTNPGNGEVFYVDVELSGTPGTTSGPPLSWGTPAGVRVVPVRTGVATATPLPPPRPITSGPRVYPQKGPARVHPALPSRGRVTSNQGAPVHSLTAGPVFRQAGAPARSRIIPPPRGRITSNKGAPVHNPAPGPVFPHTATPARSRIIPPPRGRVYSDQGAPVRNLTAGPVFRPFTSPVPRARFPLPPAAEPAAIPGRWSRTLSPDCSRSSSPAPG